jgi:hypothetical protein
MRKGRLIEEIWMKNLESYVETDGHVKVMDSMAICLTDMGGYSVYDYLALELENVLTTLDEFGLDINTMTMGAFSHAYNKLKYTVLDAAQKSLTSVVNIDAPIIRNVQIVDEPKDISFIFNVAYVSVSQGLPVVLFAALKIIEHVCEDCMVPTDKNINLYVNIGYGHLEPKYVDRAKIMVASRRAELYGDEEMY